MISEETPNPNEAHEANKLVSGEMAISQRSLLLLQKKDEELRMLKKNIQNLEQMSAKFGNRKLESEPNLM
ncbi:hypothetical protein GN156_34890, partial [bacterium LRH843]|nr:hypothetical protein [bacterium LRH843]